MSKFSSTIALFLIATSVSFAERCYTLIPDTRVNATVVLTYSLSQDCAVQDIRVESATRVDFVDAAKCFLEKGLQTWPPVDDTDYVGENIDQDRALAANFRGQNPDRYYTRSTSVKLPDGEHRVLQCYYTEHSVLTAAETIDYSDGIGHREPFSDFEALPEQQFRMGFGSE